MSEPKLSTSSNRTRVRAIGTTIERRSVAATSCSNCPPSDPVSRGKYDFLFNDLLRVGNERSEVTISHIRRHDDSALTIFSANLIWSGQRFHFGYCRKRDVPHLPMAMSPKMILRAKVSIRGRQRDWQLPYRTDVSAEMLRKPNDKCRSDDRLHTLFPPPFRLQRFRPAFECHWRSSQVATEHCSPT